MTSRRPPPSPRFLCSRYATPTATIPVSTRALSFLRIHKLLSPSVCWWPTDPASPWSTWSFDRKYANPRGAISDGPHGTDLAAATGFVHLPHVVAPAVVAYGGLHIQPPWLLTKVDANDAFGGKNRGHHCRGRQVQLKLTPLPAGCAGGWNMLWTTVMQWFRSCSLSCSRTMMSSMLTKY